MRYPAIFGSGLAVGFVIGARAGRERYDDMARTLRRLKEDPAVQSAAGLAQGQAAGAVTSVRRASFVTIGRARRGVRSPR